MHEYILEIIVSEYELQFSTLEFVALLGVIFEIRNGVIDAH